MTDKFKRAATLLITLVFVLLVPAVTISAAQVHAPGWDALMDGEWVDLDWGTTPLKFYDTTVLEAELPPAGQLLRELVAETAAENTDPRLIARMMTLSIAHSQPQELNPNGGRDRGMGVTSVQYVANKRILYAQTSQLLYPEDEKYLDCGSGMSIGEQPGEVVVYPSNNCSGYDGLVEQQRGMPYRILQIRQSSDLTILFLPPGVRNYDTLMSGEEVTLDWGDAPLQFDDENYKVAEMSPAASLLREFVLQHLDPDATEQVSLILTGEMLHFSSNGMRIGDDAGSEGMHATKMVWDGETKTLFVSVSQPLPTPDPIAYCGGTSYFQQVYIATSNECNVEESPDTPYMVTYIKYVSESGQYDFTVLFTVTEDGS